MKSKTLYIILVILVVGISAVIFLNYNKTNKVSGDNYSLPSIKKDDVATIKIKSSNGEFKISKISTGWKVDGKNADSKKVDTFLDSLSGSEVSGPASTTEDNYSHFNVNEDNGTDLEIINGQNNELLHLIIGKAGSDYGTTYFKPVGQSNVYVVASNWSSTVYKTVADWRDKTAWSFKDNEVKKVVVTQGRKVYTASLTDDNKWNIEYNGRKKTAENLQTKVLSMKASGFSEDEIKLNDSIDFYGEGDNKMLSLSVGSDDSVYYLTNSSLPDKFTFSKTIFENFWLPSVYENIEN